MSAAEGEPFSARRKKVDIASSGARDNVASSDQESSHHRRSEFFERFAVSFAVNRRNRSEATRPSPHKSLLDLVEPNGIEPSTS